MNVAREGVATLVADSVSGMCRAGFVDDDKRRDKTREEKRREEKREEKERREKRRKEKRREEEMKKKKIMEKTKDRLKNKKIIHSRKLN